MINQLVEHYQMLLCEELGWFFRSWIRLSLMKINQRPGYKPYPNDATGLAAVGFAATAAAKGCDAGDAIIIFNACVRRAAVLDDSGVQDGRLVFHSRMALQMKLADYMQP